MSVLAVQALVKAVQMLVSNLNIDLAFLPTYNSFISLQVIYLLFFQISHYNHIPILTLKLGAANVQQHPYIVTFATKMLESWFPNFWTWLVFLFENKFVLQYQGHIYKLAEVCNTCNNFCPPPLWRMLTHEFLIPWSYILRSSKIGPIGGLQYVLCILTSFWVLRASESWSKYFFSAVFTEAGQDCVHI